MRRILSMIVVAIALCVAQPASAQLGGLVNKAKKAVKEKVDNKVKMAKHEAKAAANQAAKSTASKAGLPVSDDSSDGNSSNGNAKGKHPKSLSDLDKTLFIYPLTEETELYDVTNPKVEKAYADYCNLATQKDAESRRVPHGQLEFVDYQSPNGLKQIHVTEYPLAAYYSYFNVSSA